MNGKLVRIFFESKFAEKFKNFFCSFVNARQKKIFYCGIIKKIQAYDSMGLLNEFMMWKWARLKMECWDRECSCNINFKSLQPSAHSRQIFQHNFPADHNCTQRKLVPCCSCWLRRRDFSSLSRPLAWNVPFRFFLAPHQTYAVLFHHTTHLRHLCHALYGLDRSCIIENA